MMAEGPQAGLTHSRSLIVHPSVIVPALPSLLGSLTDMPACMVGFVEATCIDALKPYLEDRGHPCRSQPCGGDARGHAGDRPGEARRRGGPQAALQGGVPGREGDYRHGASIRPGP